jgi:hypothetical protein
MDGIARVDHVNRLGEDDLRALACAAPVCEGP